MPVGVRGDPATAVARAGDGELAYRAEGGDAAQVGSHRDLASRAILIPAPASEDRVGIRGRGGQRDQGVDVICLETIRTAVDAGGAAGDGAAAGARQGQGQNGLGVGAVVELVGPDVHRIAQDPWGAFDIKVRQVGGRGIAGIDHGRAGLEVVVARAGIDEEGVDLVQVAGININRRTDPESRARRPIKIVGQQGYLGSGSVINIKVCTYIISGMIEPEEVVEERYRPLGFASEPHM